MELDELRQLRQAWRRTETPAEPDLSEEAVQQLLARRSADPVAKMQRNAWLEFMLTLVLGVMLAKVWFRLGPADWALRQGFVFAFVLLAVMTIYFLYKLRLLMGMRRVQDSLRAHLAQRLRQLRKLTRLYYWISVVSFPVTMSISAFLTVLHLPARTGSTLSWGVAAAVVAVLSIIVTPLMHWFTRWWVQQVYGQHLDRLENLLRELETEQ